MVSLDFGGTLISCPAWMDLELRDLIRAVFVELKTLGWDGGEGQNKRAAERWAAEWWEAERAESMLRDIRERARQTLREYSAQECVREIFQRTGMAVPPPHLLEEVLGRLYRGLLPQVEWLPGSREFLYSLREAGLRLALLSNAAYAPFVQWALEEAGVRHLFETVIVSDQTGWRKPHPRPFQELLRRLEVTPAAACHVGDHFEQDVVGATRAGMRAIWLRAPAAPDGPAAPGGLAAPGDFAGPGDAALPHTTACGEEHLWTIAPDLHEAARLLLHAA